MSYPKTKDEWWQMVEENWSSGLEELVHTFYGGTNIPEMPISAQAAENARQILTTQNKSLNYKELIKSKDEKILDVFNNTYWNIPESISCWEYPKFGLLCDLCSESYVLGEKC